MRRANPMIRYRRHGGSAGAGTVRSSGFSLIELIIAISIVGILTVIAVPSYQQYALRTNRTVGKTLITDVAQRQEAWFGDRKSYTSLNNLYGGTGNSAASIYVGSDGSPTQSSSLSTLYSVQVFRKGTGTVSSCSGFSTTMGTGAQYDYVVIATPQNSQLSDLRCGTLCLANTGERGATGTDGAACWTR